MAQATPKEMGPIHRAGPGSFERPYLSQRHTASMKNGRNITSVPPDENEPTKNGVEASNLMSHRSEAGTNTDRSRGW